MFWYEARNENGKVGVVPSNFLKPLEDEGLVHLLHYSCRISFTSDTESTIVHTQKHSSFPKINDVIQKKNPSV